MSSLLTAAPDVGTTYRLWREFRTLDLVGTLVDPEDVTLIVEDPMGYRYTINAARESQGVFYGDIRLQVAGQWRFRWISDNPRFAYEGSFVARRSEIEEPNEGVGFPARFPDVSFFYADALGVKFPFYAMSNDGLTIGRLDISPYSFRAVAKTNGRVALSQSLQPELDMSQAETGLLRVAWTQEQVALLPDTFWLEISEYAGFDPTDDPDIEPLTWNQLPDFTWNQLPDFTWNEFPDQIAPLPIWDRTILVGYFRKTFANAL